MGAKSFQLGDQVGTYDREPGWLLGKLSVRCAIASLTCHTINACACAFGVLGLVYSAHVRCTRTPIV